MRKKSERVPESPRRPESQRGLSRTPASRGGLYCSPACGAGCTRREHDQAVRDADRLVKRLRGSGWRAEVWENLGWHFRAVSGTVQVFGDRRGENGKWRYTCLISDDVGSPRGGSSLWTDKCPDRCHGDPNEAVASMFTSAVAATTRVLEAVYAAARATGALRMDARPLLAKLASASTEQVPAYGKPAAPVRGSAELSPADRALADMVKPGQPRRRLPN
jgi:hypothetical protein